MKKLPLTEYFEFGSEFDWDSNKIIFSSKIKNRQFDDMSLFRSGRDALKALAIYLKNGHSRILMPALCCESMVSPFTMNGYKVVFYRLNSDFSINEEDLFGKLKDNDLILFQNYFGVESLQSDFVKKTREKFKNTVLIEDRTQNFVYKGLNTLGRADFVTASLRKWFALSDGGVINPPISVEAEKNNEFSNLRKFSLLKKSIYFKTRDEIIKNEFRNELNMASEMLDESNLPVVISNESVENLKSTDFKRMYRLRLENFRTLRKHLKPLEKKEKLTLFPRESEHSTLYFPVLIKDRENIQTALAKRNIYCPVIWPVPDDAVGVCDISDDTAQHILAIPCDHRYSKKDMKMIAEKLKEILNGDIANAEETDDIRSKYTSTSGHN